ncbi:TetR family transcriptional regulator [Nakamurella sp. YIM 132087]|uniref:TetR family transcriptional regulator n=1 Tax=Nakamurella alba TaxID=2665158 RepID=A0A7K1FH57_9ACTN|nr:TetR/AcrR family transcriptional regulator [Nakamurella alba]MTD13438.1 TetR family transcriptional regulator [Nakamurella alba]
MTGPRLRLTREERRSQMLEVATDVFYERGYDQASLQEIATRMGLLKGSLYYYIDSKEDLLFDVIRTAHDELFDEVAGLAAGPGDAFERLERVIHGHVGWICAHLRWTRVFLHELRSLPVPRRQEVLASRHPYQTLLRTLILEAQRTGLARPDVHPPLAALTLLGALNWSYRWFTPNGESKPAAIAATIADLTLHGLRLPPQRA